MTQDEWNLVVKVHLTGHFVPLRHAAEHWKLRQKAGEDVRGAVVNTASASGTTLPNAGRVNYDAQARGPRGVRCVRTGARIPAGRVPRQQRCEATGRLFNVGGGSISEIHGWTTGEAWSTDGPWTVDAVAALFEPVAAA